jgi:hypothetical protein
MARKGSRILLAGLAGVALVLLFLCLNGATPARAGTNIHCVNTSGTGCGVGCGGGCYSSVQAAVNAATDGHEIHIAGGTYYGPGAGTVAVIAKGLLIRGGYDAACSGHDPDMYETVLDAQWGGSVVSVTNATDVVLLNLTLTRGDATGNCSQGGCGGGIFACGSNLQVGACVITNNVALTAGSGDYGYGGGICVQGGGADIWGSQVVSNVASTSSDPTGYGYGGGIAAFLDFNGVTLRENQIRDNLGAMHRGGNGGGVYLWSVMGADVLTNVIRGNRGTIAAGQDSCGAGIYIITSSRITVAGNHIEGNSANPGSNGSGQGGGVYIRMADVNLTRNTIVGNSTGQSASSWRLGGGVAAYSAGPLTLTNNLIALNDSGSAGGGGLYVDWESTPPVRVLLVNNTIADNGTHAAAAGIRVDDDVALVMTNTIVAGHTVGLTNTNPASSAISADTNLFWNTSDPITGAGGTRQDPLLLSSYRLSEGSPALDAALTISWLTVDLDGNPRPEPGGSDYDIGAFEGARWEVYLPLVLKN